MTMTARQKALYDFVEDNMIDSRADKDEALKRLEGPIHSVVSANYQHFYQQAISAEAAFKMWALAHKLIEETDSLDTDNSAALEVIIHLQQQLDPARQDVVITEAQHNVLLKITRVALVLERYMDV